MMNFPITPEQAKKIISRRIVCKTETIAVQDSLGRRLARRVVSPENFPAFTRSLYDGFAVDSRKYNVGAIHESPLRISTGGILPRGKDAVVMLEDMNVGAVREPPLRVRSGQNVVFAGEDVKKGRLLFPEKWKIRSQDIGLLLGLGIRKVKVFRKICVGIVSTGSEIVPSNKMPGYGQVRDMNSGMLFNLVLQSGGVPIFLGICPDKKEAVVSYVNKIYKQKLDVILFTGGTSVGGSDVLEDALLSVRGSKILFHGLKMKPGKTTLAGLCKGRLIIGFSGRPSSAFVVFHLLMRPILAGSQNASEAVLKTDVSSNPEIEEYLPASIEQKNGTFYAQPIFAKPSLFSPMIFSDGMIKIPIGQKIVKKGQAVETNLY